MSLFQNNVVKKYTNTLDKKKLDEKWLLFTATFHNIDKQNNIRNSKEEQYQEGFLRDLFVQILGYTLNPDVNFNLISEKKNETNGKKADGAIILNDNVHAVIELKGTETTDLGKIENQAFGYKNNQKNCSYVIISNFEKLRFYIDNATEHIEFNLFTLSRTEFDLLYTCLSLESMQTDLPKKIKNESVSNEDKITKELYKDYSAFRKELFTDIEKLNPQYDRLLLFKKTQKLLDRFLFIFFAEDRQLLPTNLIRSINLEWKNLREARIPVSLYDRYKMYFNDLNTGARVSLPAFGKNTNEIVTAQYDIYAYNGGLFQPDDVLDNITIDDDLLYTHSIKLSTYDFESEVDVNILGHIFENSLNEIDEITNAIEGQVIDKTKTKRKKDGVFYTPKYITKYIVDNTIGKLCEEKKTELTLDETKYTTDKRITVATKKKLIETLDSYRKWLLQLTIVDPACGSGAFLNQALEFLIAEHRYVDELQAKLFGDALVLSDVEGSILENNLFGVDLNEESVEIAKLSLWLRTAQRNRKLNSLSNNIKCGNSLIDDAMIAGDKAFNWQNEFPQVFEKGGFDVVIGNPPYVVLPPINFINYNYIKGNNNTYVAFVELSINVINNKGEIGLIIPNTWFSGDNFLDFREYIISKNNLSQLIQLPYDIFEAYVDTSIVLINKSENSKFTKYYRYDIRDYQNNIDFKSLNVFPNSSWIKYGKIFLSNDLLKIGEKVWFSNKNILLGKISKINRGCLPPKDDEKSEIQDDHFNIKWFDNQVFRYSEDVYKTVYVNYESLRENKSIEVYKGRRIFGRQLMSRQFRMNLTLIDYDCAFKKNLYVIYNIDCNFLYEYILSILNSRIFSFTQLNFNTSLQRDDFPAFSLMDFKNFTIPNIKKEKQLIFKEKADLMLALNKDLQEVSSKFSKYFSGQFKLEKLSSKLEKWYELSFEEFIKEINKTIKAQKGTPLTKKDEFDWMDLFEENKQKANKLQTEIATTDKAIDTMVYELYGLSEEEIKIVEGS